MWTVIKSCKGMSLVEAVVSVAMLGGMVLISTQSILVQRSFVSNVRGSQNMASLVDEITSVMADQASCTSTITGLDPVAGDTFTQIKRKNSAGVISTLYSVNDYYMGQTLQLKQFRVSSFTPTKSATRGIMKVTIEALPGTGLTKNTQVSQDFIVEVDIDGGNNILSCAGSKESYAQIICTSLGGTIINNRCSNLNITNQVRTTGDITSGSRLITPNFIAPTISAASLATDNLSSGVSLYSGGDINATRVIPSGASIALMAHERVVAFQGPICLNGVCRNFDVAPCVSPQVAKGINADGSLNCQLPPPVPPVPAVPAFK